VNAVRWLLAKPLKAVGVKNLEVTHAHYLRL